MAASETITVNGLDLEITECRDCGDRGVCCTTPDGEVEIEGRLVSVAPEIAEAGLVILCGSMYSPSDGVCDDCEEARRDARTAAAAGCVVEGCGAPGMTCRYCGGQVCEAHAASGGSCCDGGVCEEEN